MPDENSNPNMLAPAAPLPAPNGVLSINTRTLVMVASFFIGGGATGGGLTLFSGPAAAASDLEESIDELTTKVTAMSLLLATMVEADKSDDKEIDDLEADIEVIKERLRMLDNHEARLQALERDG